MGDAIPPQEITISIGDLNPTEPILATLDTKAWGALDPDQNREERLYIVCERYQALNCQDMPTLALGEWLALCDALNSTIRDSDSIQHLDHGIEDAVALDGLAAKWDIDGDDFVQRLKAMTFGQKLAIVEIVDRWWGEYDGKLGGKTAEAFQALGAKIAK